MVICGLVLISCGDNPTAVPETNNPDVREQEVSDDLRTIADVEDVAPEDVEDEEVPIPETVCDDGLDNDGDLLADCHDPDCGMTCEDCSDLIDNNEDGLIDCEDPTCSRDIGCPEFCGNDQDDDGDELADCDDPECATAPRCLEDPVSVDDYVFSDRLGYFWRMQYSLHSAPCCFDFNGDGEPDNNLQTILAMIPNYDAQSAMNYQVNLGNVAVMLEWVEFPETLGEGGSASFNIYRGVPIDPEPPEALYRPHLPENNFWNMGNGVFQITRDSFDSRGPRVRFRNTAVESPHSEREDVTAELNGGPSMLNITVPITEIGLTLDLNLYDAQIAMDLETISDDEDGPDEIRTVERAVGDDIVGGGRLGGYVRADDLMRFLNESGDRCDCARPPEESPPTLEYGERVGTGGINEYYARCRWVPLSPTSPAYTCAEDDDLCPNMSAICLAVSAIPLVLDVDSNKNEVNDSISVGLYFDLVGATLADEPVTAE